MGGSQLKQLKSRINDEGLNTRKGKNSKNHRRSLGDPATRSQKLSTLHQEFNVFDVKHVKPKHAIMTTRQVNNTAKGKPALSKQAAIENRKKTLLPELLDRNRAGGIIDRRFGENDPSLSIEERNLARFQKERQRLSFKKNAFNLEDEDTLTHYGRTLALDNTEQPSLPSQEEQFAVVNRKHPLSDDSEDEEPVRKKSKAEVMEEVVAKSKAYKYERQKTRTEDDELRHALDDDLLNLRLALGQSIPKPVSKRIDQDEEDESQSERSDQDDNEESDASDAEGHSDSDSEQEDNEEPSSSGVDRALLAKLIGSPSASPEPKPDQDKDSGKPTEKEEDDYDRFVKELNFDKKTRPSDRLKSDAELAQERAQELQRAEKARLARMQGLDPDDDSANKAERRPRGGDDLDDDFGLVSDEDEFGLGQGLDDGPESMAVTLGDSDSEAILADSDLELAQLDGEEDEASEDSSSDNEEDSENEMWDDDEEAGASQVEDEQPLIAVKSKSKQSKTKETAYAFECPGTHGDFLSLLDGKEDDADVLKTIIERTRTLYHPSLAEGNKDKLAVFLGVLIDHALFVTQSFGFGLVNVLTPHILSLSNSYPLESARHFISKLTLMQKNLVRGLTQSATSLSAAKIWPSEPELALFRLIGLVWSTSDFSHPVAAPALLLMCQYLSQSRIRSLQDLKRALFLCTLCLEYETRSKRIIPEAVNLLQVAVLLIAPNKFTEADLPGVFPTRDLFQPALKPLRFGKKAKTPNNLAPSVTSIANDSDDAEKMALLSTAITLLDRFSQLYASLPGYIELFEPVSAILSHVEQQKSFPKEGALHATLITAKANMDRILTRLGKERQPLFLQHFKPVAIPTFAPKYDAGFRPGQHAFDPDTTRAETAKLKALIKKEKKGAIRELRKDTRFIAGERARMRKEKDDEYRHKINTIKAGLEQERAEEKGYERTKAKLKRMDKKRAGRG